MELHYSTKNTLNGLMVSLTNIGDGDLRMTIYFIVVEKKEFHYKNNGQVHQRTRHHDT